MSKNNKKQHKKNILTLEDSSLGSGRQALKKTLKDSYQ
jgi:hypothetical protein